jgi:hypothetical protein
MTSDDLFAPSGYQSTLFFDLVPFGDLVRGTPNGESLEDPQPFPGVYVFAAYKAFGRLKGSSDILYIGSAGQISSRLTEYARVARKWPHAPPGRKGAELKIAEFYANQSYELTLGWTYTLEEQAGWSYDLDEPPSLRQEASALETELLRRYESDHGETPPFNSQVGVRRTGEFT